MSDNGAKFVELCLSGMALPSDIDDFVDQWHEAKDDGVDLAEFLGLTADEYYLWVQDSSFMPIILAARKNKKNIRIGDSHANDNYWRQMAAMAARTNNQNEIDGAIRWLEEHGRLVPSK